MKPDCGIQCGDRHLGHMKNRMFQEVNVAGKKSQHKKRNAECFKEKMALHPGQDLNVPGDFLIGGYFHAGNDAFMIALVANCYQYIAHFSRNNPDDEGVFACRIVFKVPGHGRPDFTISPVSPAASFIPGDIRSNCRLIFSKSRAKLLLLLRE